jgi:hypothetical protein
VRCRLLLPVLLATACASTPSALPSAGPTATPTVTPTATKSPTPTQAPYVLGASPLPLRADGFGQVLPTPQALRDRRLTAKDTLPTPTDGRFHATTSPISQQLRTRMGQTYQVGCPVPLSTLSYLTLTFRGFDGRPHTGELVVATSVAAAVVRIFHDLYDQGFPIEQMTLPTTADVTAKPTGDGNDTAGFVCRPVRGQTRFSAHSSGLAIDVNPFQNPEKKGDLVLPELASAYTDRSWVRPGMIRAGSRAAHAFTREGWTWGGTFRSLKDYMHFSENGR